MFCTSFWTFLVCPMEIEDGFATVPPGFAQMMRLSYRVIDVACILVLRFHSPAHLAVVTGPACHVILFRKVWDTVGAWWSLFLWGCRMFLRLRSFQKRTKMSPMKTMSCDIMTTPLCWSWWIAVSRVCGSLLSGLAHLDLFCDAYQCAVATSRWQRQECLMEDFKKVMSKQSSSGLHHLKQNVTQITLKSPRCVLLYHSILE